MLALKPYKYAYLCLQGQLELMTGGSASTMKIEIYTKDNKYIGTCDNDEAYLGYYVTCDGMRLHVRVQIYNCSKFSTEFISPAPYAEHEH